MIREIEGQGYAARWGRYTTDDGFSVGVLIFFKTADVQTSEDPRVVIVPRSLARSLAI